MYPRTAHAEVVETATTTIVELMESTPLGVPAELADADTIDADLLIRVVDDYVLALACHMGQPAARINFRLNDAIDPVYDVL